MFFELFKILKSGFKQYKAKQKSQIEWTNWYLSKIFYNNMAPILLTTPFLLKYTAQSEMYS